MCQNLKHKHKMEKLHTRNHFVADEIACDFDEMEKFGQYLGTVARIGCERAYRIWREGKDLAYRIPDFSPQKFFWKQVADLTKAPE